MLHSDTPFHSLEPANKTWTAHQSWARCHGTQWRFMDEEEMWWREHFTTPALQKTLTRHQSYFYTVIITKADRHRRRPEKKKNRKGKRTKRVHFLSEIHISWRVMYPKTKTDTGCLLSPLSLLLKTSLLSFSPLSIFFCGLILVNFLHFKSLDHSNGCWLCSILLDIKWSHLLVV